MNELNTKPNRKPERWMVLFACIIAVLMVVIDSGIINLIVPSIQKDLKASESTICLMASISTLMLAAFTLGGGTLGDIYGRRRFILIGTGGMVATAMLSMVAPSAESLIGIRSMTGIFEALVSPLAAYPLASSIFGPEGMAQINIPTFILSGSNDIMTPAVMDQVYPYLWMPQKPKYLGLMVEGTHFSTSLDDVSQNLPAILIGCVGVNGR